MVIQIAVMSRGEHRLIGNMRNATYKSNLNKFSKYLEDKDDRRKKCSECNEHPCVCFVENFENKNDKKKKAK
jgi:hypothetical protein